ncbi:hypothetical protein [Bacillus smithii]|uniref:hypothetical protein n=1 Tax=Bacillus smithii TaxID=1479 RepID=UPI003D224690
MDGSFLARSLSSLKGDELRYLYILFCKTNIWDIVSNKTKDWLSRDHQDHFFKYIETETKNCAPLSEDELRLSIFLQLLKVLKIKGGRFHTVFEITKGFDQVIEETFQLLSKKNRDFSAFAKQHHLESQLGMIVSWQFSQLLKDFHRRLNEDSTEWYQTIADTLNSLPINERQQLKSIMMIDQFDSEQIRRWIENEGIVQLVNALTSVSGYSYFGEFLQRFRELRSFSNTAFSQLTTDPLLFFLLSPDFLYSLLFGPKLVPFRYQHLLFSNELVPFVLLEIMLHGLEAPYSQLADVQNTADVWSKRYRNYISLLLQLEKNRSEQEQYKKERNDLESERSTILTMKKESETYLSIAKEKLKNQLIADENRPYFGDTTVEYYRIKEKMENIDKKLEQKKAGAKGVVKSVASFLQSSFYLTEKAQWEKKLNKIFDEMTELTISKYPDYDPVLTQEIEHSALKRDECEKQLTEAEKKLTEVEQRISQLKKEERELLARKEEAEKETYGLKQLGKDRNPNLALSRKR